MVVGTGHYLPEKIITNADIEKMVETSDEWITTRTGIKERHVAAPDEATSDLSAKAALRALEDANVDPEEIELIITGTINGDMKFPATSVFVQEKIGNKNAVGFDLGGACCGFLYSLVAADAMIGSGGFNNALVIGTEILTRITDWTDRGTCILFGDASGAMVLKKTDGIHGLLSSDLHSDGTTSQLLYFSGEGTKHRTSEQTIKDGRHFLKMKGNEVFKHAVIQMANSSVAAIEKTGLKPSDIDVMIPHQANIRIIDATAKRLKFDHDRVIINIDKTGNTSSATIPTAMDQAIKSGRIEKGMNVLMAVFGAGLTWGAAVLKY